MSVSASRAECFLPRPFVLGSSGARFGKAGAVDDGVLLAGEPVGVLGSAAEAGAMFCCCCCVGELVSSMLVMMRSLVTKVFTRSSVFSIVTILVLKTCTDWR